MEPLQHNSELQPSFKTKLIRGATGGYGWEITIYGCATEMDHVEMNERAVRSINMAIKFANENVEYPAKPGK